MTEDHATYSKDFPEGYGDFKLIASDGVIFCFPKAFLSWMSPVFADMLSVGGDTSDAGDIQKQVSVTEDSTTLDLLLRFFDPKKKVRPLEEQTLPALLEAARKYQVPEVMDWWEEQVKLEKQGPSNEVTTVIKYPMLSLALAVRHGLDNTARLALRELIKAPSSEIQTKLHFDSTLLTHLIQLRQERYKILSSKMLDYYMSRDRCVDCIWHYAELSHHMARLIAALADEPSLRICQTAVSWPVSPCRWVHWASSQEMLEKWWISEITTLEDELPSLPAKPCEHYLQICFRL
ncbi:hypothetical protein PIIN_07397 [Serendipita indica DSM 11827]|uniref:BTB domain-containing protein n=1 Tax=Serendipita indica (strain DSM 11827) TaxID=1109443 RepID=G4TQ50_SERID|nr:hypothetical protein PIIN_07397 [Serendipita indica DSM 11827]